MPIVSFSKAVRTGSHVLISFVGESGSGKTLSALLLGRGLVGPNGVLGLLDTETGRGKIYADKVPGGYLYGELTPPFSPERYIEAVQDAEKAGVQCLIVDSTSHEWEGLGGLLEIAELQTTNEGGELKGLVKWAKPKQRHKKFMQTLLTTRMHMLFCLRAKEKMAQQGTKIVSTGFVPIQDKHFVYEMTVQLFLPNEGPRGIPNITKCPGELLGAFPEGKQIGINTGKAIAAWVAEGAPIDHALETMKRDAELIAEQGAEKFRTYWKNDLSKEDRAKLRPYLANFESIARTADEDKPPPPVTFGKATVPTEAELRDEFLPMQQDAYLDGDAEERAEIDGKVRAVIAPFPELIALWERHVADVAGSHTTENTKPAAATEDAPHF